MKPPIDVQTFIALETEPAPAADKLTPQRTRAQLYDALAQALNDPAMVAGPPRRSPLATIAEQGASVLGSTACRNFLFELAELPPVSGGELRRCYTNILAGPLARPLATYESLALTDRLAGQATQQVERWFRQFGLEADGDLPDSASAELAFMAFLVEAEIEAKAESQKFRDAQRRFLRQHPLTWLPHLGSQLSQADDPYIAAIGRLLAGFLNEEHLRTARPASGRSGTSLLPVIPDDATCSLCGFCVQTCPTGALRVAETDVATSLLMAADRCIGCGRCVSVCTEHILQMEPRARREPDGVTLYRSPRARCPRCGRPTVSQAEMAAVFARLEADAAMRRRLSLCNTCKAR